ncbi:MAG TPA: hypothetical protein VLG37_01450 [Candidatus Saccharimonadales bacterium]|nr:hypothetical protein [Candidatus Saccharimonadales bacterium]
MHVNIYRATAHGPKNWAEDIEATVDSLTERLADPLLSTTKPYWSRDIGSGLAQAVAKAIDVRQRRAVIFSSLNENVEIRDGQPYSPYADRFLARMGACFWPYETEPAFPLSNLAQLRLASLALTQRRKSPKLRPESHNSRLFLLNRAPEGTFVVETANQDWPQMVVETDIPGARLWFQGAPIDKRVTPEVLEGHRRGQAIYAGVVIDLAPQT